MVDTIHTLNYLLTQEAEDGQPSGSYILQYLRDFMVSVAAGTATTSRTATGSTTMLASDSVIFMNQTAAATVTLVSSPVLNQMIYIKDISGNAVTNNITIDPPGSVTVDGNLTFLLNNNYASVTLIFNGTNWNIL